MNLRTTFKSALAVVALASAFAIAKPPAGFIEINYHRADGKYDNWGVHLWKSPNMPLPDIEWPNPMMPTGTNSFGVYWHVKASEFDTGSKRQVNYIIHRGDIKEQGAKDMAFDGNKFDTIWVWEKDRAIYTSYDDLKAAHPDAPPAE
jgi:pullulanase